MPFGSCHQPPSPLHIPDSDPPEGQSFWSQFSYLGRIFMLGLLTGCQPANGLATDTGLCPVQSPAPMRGKGYRTEQTSPWKRSIGGVVSPSLNQGAYHWLDLRFTSPRRARKKPCDNRQQICLSEIQIEPRPYSLPDNLRENNLSLTGFKQSWLHMLKKKEDSQYDFLLSTNGKTLYCFSHIRSCVWTDEV